MPKSIAEIFEDMTAPGQMFEIDTIDVRGVPTRTWKNAPGNLRSVLDLSSLHGAKEYMVFEDERMTFDQHYRTVATFAHRLMDDLGVVKGDRVAIAMRNFPEWVVTFFAATAIGAVAVPLNAWWKPDELVYGLADSGATVLVADEDRAAMLRGRLGETSVRHVVVARAEQPLGDGELDFASVLGEVDPAACPPDVDVAPEDDATIFYTSGTTGNPKGALGTHRNICTSVMNSAFGALVGATRKAQDEGSATLDVAAMASAAPENCSLVSVPFFHVTGCHGFLLTSTAFGAKLVLMYKWDPGRALELIARERVTLMGGVPSMALQMLDHPDFATADLSSLTNISYGGAPAPPELVKRIRSVLPGRSPANGWGMTETSAGFTMNSGPDYIRKPTAVGPAIPVGEAKIVDEDGAEVPMGDRGELLVKGPGVIKGYWNKPEANADTFTDGWLRTGDIATIDDEGFISIVDRAKDVVIRGGENVYCAEVEAALFEHPAVADCAVIGIPHPVLGEEVGAVVVTRAGVPTTEAELAAHVRERLAGFKAPTHIWFRTDEMPRNAAGKILKRDLRDEVLRAPEPA